MSGQVCDAVLERINAGLETSLSIGSDARGCAMGATALNIQNEPEHNVEIVLHIDEDLAEMQRKDLASYLEDEAGINSCFFCNNRFHLMLVYTDSQARTRERD
jgi:hypothetical protein